MSTIIVDAFGGDNAPLEILKGCELAVKRHSDIDIILTGNKEIIELVASENGISLDRMKIHHCTDVISMCDEPSSIVREHNDCTMANGLKLLKQGDGIAFVSAGSTGALLVGSTLIVKRIKGVKRCALAPIMPNMSGFHMLIDCGANIECKPEMLCQFGIMGSVYMQKVMGIASPRVGLLNIGSEETKGGELQKDALVLLKDSGINFVGNVEPWDVVNGEVDALVTDGYTGNVFLKLYEAMPKAMFTKIKEIFYKNLKTKVAAAMIKSDMLELRTLLNADRYGGAPIMGCSKPVFKAHGSSKAEAFYSAITLAKSYYEADAANIIAEAVSAKQ